MKRIIPRKYTRVCKNCRESFDTNREVQKFCKQTCAAQYYKDRYHATKTCADKKIIATGSTGAAKELLVCANLLLRGFHVFRAQSPACPCDLIVLYGNKTILVEVTTGYMSTDGKMMFRRKRPTHVFDVLAVVDAEGEIYYLGTDESLITHDDLRTMNFAQRSG